MITERLLQYIWQYQHFNLHDLKLTNGEIFQVIHAGIYNSNQGPDFLGARIKSGETILVGSIELHIKSSDWFRHAHQLDANYDNVILHVVWEDDQPILSGNIPVFCLQDRVQKLLLSQYENWMNSQSFIPCNMQVSDVNKLIWYGWKERLLIERLQRKSVSILNCLHQTNQHWEEVFWRMLARNFGIRINADSFEAIACSLPMKILAKHKNQLHQLEALLLGQAGLLEGQFEEEYPLRLQQDYVFYKKKYGLQPVKEPVHFLRMRPSAFPTVRLAQLAMLVHEAEHLFTVVREANNIRDVKQVLEVIASDYWHDHYTFNVASVSRPKMLGRQMIENIIINTIVPVLYAYGHFYQYAGYIDKALDWLIILDAEQNQVTSEFTELGIRVNHAYDSQALIELKTQYCDQKRCLDCSVGYALLKNMVVTTK